MNEALLDFWFGTLDEHGHADAAHAQRWFTRDPDFDRALSDRFGALHAAVVAGQHDDWLPRPRGRLAYLIVLDQLSRNLFRDDPRAFAQDARALAVATEGMSWGMDRQLVGDQRHFVYLPLMHAEDLDAQQQCVALFTEWQRDAVGPSQERLTRALRFAEQHRDIIQRFGRFPRRNAVLGRTSTADELEFLKQPSPF